MIFIDTGAFLGRYLQKDQYHEDAITGWQRLGKINARLFTSNFILDESLTLLGRRANYGFAAERARKIYSSEALTVLRPMYEDEMDAVDLFEKYGDQRVSLTDCVSFVLMRNAKIKRAFTFDRHFQLAGFEMWPARSLS